MVYLYHCVVLYLVIPYRICVHSYKRRRLSSSTIRFIYIYLFAVFISRDKFRDLSDINVSLVSARCSERVAYARSTDSLISEYYSRCNLMQNCMLF